MITVQRWTRCTLATFGALSTATLLATAIGGCNSGNQTSDGQSVASAYEALSGRINACGVARRDCAQSANCDPTALQACDQQYDSCKAAARAQEQALRDAAHACFAAARDCESKLTDASTDGRQACRDQLHMCLDANRPPEAACFSSLRDCIGAAHQLSSSGGAAGAGGGAGASGAAGASGPAGAGAWANGAGHFGRGERDESPETEAAEMVCVQQARDCISAIVGNAAGQAGAGGGATAGTGAAGSGARCDNRGGQAGADAHGQFPHRGGPGQGAAGRPGWPPFPSGAPGGSAGH